MTAEVVAVGTELTSGYIGDTNSGHIASRLALAGIDCHRMTAVDDHVERIADAVRSALGRSQAVIVCGGLGPTTDDVTRQALALLTGQALESDPEMESSIRALFEARGRAMPLTNLAQAEKPPSCRFIPQRLGTAPGLVCPMGDGPPGSGSLGGGSLGGGTGRAGVVYAVPGVPAEMAEMVDRVVIPELVDRAGPGAGVLRSRSLRIWGTSEADLGERVAPREGVIPGVHIAYLASAGRGLTVRITARGTDARAASDLLDAEEAELRALLGPMVFGVDADTLAAAVGRLVADGNATVAVAESLTAGLVASALAETAGSSAWFRGGVVAYDKAVKFGLLGVPEGPVVTAAAAEAMARGVARLLGADIGLATTGAAGPEPHEGQPPGTVFLASVVGGHAQTSGHRFGGDRTQVRQLSVMTLLDQLRRTLMAGS
ncbi:MAG: nicotinamide-nucleotide amidohydrolase family protein [Acidimicrobiales bacterium]